MKEVVHRYELVAAAGVKTAADLHVVSSQQSHRCPILLLKHLPLQGGAQQQQMVVCIEEPERDRNLSETK